MKHRLADLRLLRSFVTVARLGGVTRAAEVLNLTQPALSQHLRELTRIAGTPLLEKFGRGVKLTPGGIALREDVEPLLDQLDMSLQSIQSRGDVVQGALRIGAIASYARILVAPLAARMLAAHPGLFVSTVELTGAQIDRALNDGDIDVGVAFSKLTAGSIEQELLFEEQLVLAGKGLENKHINLTDLADIPLALLNSSFAMRRQIDESLAMHRVTPDLRLETDNVDTLLSLAGSGAVASIVGELSACNAPGLGIATISDAGLVRLAALRWRKGRRFKGALGEFRTQLLEQVKSLSGASKCIGHPVMNRWR